MFRLAMRSLRSRKGAFAATFVAIFFGATIVMACGGLMETGVRTAVPPQRLAAAPIVVQGDQSFEMAKENPKDPEEDAEWGWLPERVGVAPELAGTIQKVSGVDAVVPDIDFPAAVVVDGEPVGGSGSQGHNWSSAQLAPYTLDAGSAPASAGEVVLDSKVAGQSGARVGADVDVMVGGTPRSFEVVGIAHGAVDAPAVFFADETAAELSGAGDLVDGYGVLLDPGAKLAGVQDALDTALEGSGAVSLSGDDRGRAEYSGLDVGGENLIVMAAVFGGLAVSVSLFVVASTLGLSIQQRQRELALLRAVGTTPRQMRRMVLGEASVVAVVASALAWLPGMLLGRFLFDQLSSRGIAPRDIVFHQGWVPVVSAAGASLLAALAAAWVAGRRAGRTRPTEALSDAALQTRWLSPFRLIAAVLCLAGGVALVIVTITVMTGPVAASTAGPTVMLFAIGLALLGPGIARVITGVLGRPLRAFTGLGGYLATAGAKARKVRLAGVITPIMLVTGMATAMIYLQLTSQAAEERAFLSDLRADAVLTSSTGGLSPDLVETVAEQPGVAGASGFVSSAGYIERPYDGFEGDEGLPLRGISADGAEQTSAYTLTEGSLTDLRGDSVVLPVEHAAEIGVGVGDDITMRLGDGRPVDLTVVGLVRSEPGAENGLLPAELLAAHTTDGLLPQIHVRAAPGVDQAQLVESLHGLAADVPGLQVSDRTAMVAANEEQGEIGLWINYLMAGMIVGYTVIAMVNTIVLATRERRREFALHRLTGATRAQLIRMMGMEGVLSVLAGVFLGTLVAALSLLPFTVLVSDSVIPDGPLWIYLGLVGFAAVLTLATTLAVTWAALRDRPVDVVATA